MTRRCVLATLCLAGCGPGLTDVPCVDGHAGRYPCDGIDLLAFVPAAAFDAGTANDVWGWTDPSDGREVVLLGLDNGVGFVDVSDPLDPVVLGHLPAAAADSHWRDVKTYADHAFVVSEADGHGVQVFDLRTLPDDDAGTLTEAAVHAAAGTAHNLSIDETSGRAYLSGQRTCEGLYVLDVQEPTDPWYDGCIELGYVHDAQCLTWDAGDADHLGRQLCFAASPDAEGLVIVDVTERHVPEILSITTYPEHRYAHQGWLTEDHGWFLLDDEADDAGNFGTRTYVFDVHDLDAPFYVGAYEAADRVVDHNLFIAGGRVYEANYNGGLRVLRPVDLSRADLEEVAFFDTSPDRDGNLTQGAWSVYPWFDSGVVPVSTYVGPFGLSRREERKEGLFLLRVHQDR